jgi:Phosphate-selective porin O and P
MKRLTITLAAIGLLAFLATPALADTQPTARDIQAAVNNYLTTVDQDANLVGGPGSAGYDAGFWIRGGDFSLRINLTLQARYEYFDWSDVNEEEVPGGDLSGFSLPRATVKFSGDAPCNTHYYLELEFGHQGDAVFSENLPGITAPFHAISGFTPWEFQSRNFDNSREAWIEHGFSDAFNVRMGQIKTPNTRQLMVSPEMQQFVDISMASAITGQLQPGYTDRNRDFGIMVHGTLGCNNEWSYMLAVTNGDGGDSLRNVLDPFTDDNLAYSARVNWAFLNPIGYTEGATNQSSCTWYGELGAWAHYYAQRLDKPHTAIYDRLAVGGDLALGYGGWSFTGAFTVVDWKNSDIRPDDKWTIWLAQLGYLFPDTAWELAVRWSHYTRDFNTVGKPKTDEFAAGVNYYLNGHANKLSLDVSWIKANADGIVGGGYYDVYAGVPMGYASNDKGLLIRFQWQLAL